LPSSLRGQQFVQEMSGIARHCSAVPTHETGQAARKGTGCDKAWKPEIYITRPRIMKKMTIKEGP
jgi:hypothetical protein